MLCHAVFDKIEGASRHTIVGFEGEEEERVTADGSLEAVTEAVAQRVEYIAELLLHVKSPCIV